MGRYPLTPIIKPSNRDNRFAVCDIEAHKWINFKVIGFYDGMVFQEFRDLGKFFEYVAENYAEDFDVHPKRNQREVNIFAHFGGKYDFNFLLEWVALESDKDLWSVGDIIPRGSGMLNFVCNYKTKGKPPVQLTFWDSSALLPFSLAKLTQSFDVKHKKGHIDFEKWDGKVTKELLDYLKDDCRGLYEVLERFYNWPKIRFAGPAKTMAGQAMKVFQTYLETEIFPLSDSVDEFVRVGYFGGRTEIFKPYFEADKKTDLLAYDANSLYPSVMLDYDYPGACLGFTNRYYPDRMGFYDAEVEVPEGMYCPPLGTVWAVPTVQETKGGKTKTVKTPKFIFPTGRFTGRWSVAELEYAKTVGVKIISTGRGVTFRNGGPIFKDYIKDLYKMRMDAKEKGDGVTDVLTKLLMNSTYGRFGIQKDRELLVIDEGQSGIRTKDLKIGDTGLCLGTKGTELDTFAHVGIAAYVTSYARIRMHQFYMKAGKKLWYTDTDSLYTTKNFTDSSKLGALKYEGKYKKACFLLPKTYALEDGIISKITMKGFDRKKTKDFTVSDFVNALEGDMKLITAKQPAKFATFKTALRKGGFLRMIEETDRTLKTRYDKRRIVKDAKGNYDTIPLHIRDGEIVNDGNIN